MNNTTLIKDSLISLLNRDESVRLFCEGINDSFYNTIPSVDEISRPAQLEELPISEAAAIGLVTGASMFGIRPVVCFQRVEFGILALDQLITNASKTSFLSDGKLTSPFLLRMVIGRGWGQGPCHSQSFETLWHSIPGLRVFMPASSKDYHEVFSEYERTDSPIISLEHRWTHGISVDTTVDRTSTNPIATIFSYSYNSVVASRVASVLATHGIEIDVINASCFSLAIDSVCKSVALSGRLVTLDLGPSFLGLSAELIVQLVEKKVKLIAQPIRIGTPFEPASASPEKAYRHFPCAAHLFEALEALLPDCLAQLRSARLEFDRACDGQPSDIPGQYFKGPF